MVLSAGWTSMRSRRKWNTRLQKRGRNYRNCSTRCANSATSLWGKPCPNGKRDPPGYTQRKQFTPKGSSSHPKEAVHTQRKQFTPEGSHSHPKEDLLFVQHIKKRPFYCQVAAYHRQIVPGIGDNLLYPMKEAVGCIVPVDDMTGDIDQDGVHADHHKKESPFLIPPDIDHVVEERQQQQADPAYIEHKGACPQILIDRENGIPGQPQPQTNAPRQRQPHRFGGGRGSAVL